MRASGSSASSGPTPRATRASTRCWRAAEDVDRGLDAAAERHPLDSGASPDGSCCASHSPLMRRRKPPSSCCAAGTAGGGRLAAKRRCSKSGCRATWGKALPEAVLPPRRPTHRHSRHGRAAGRLENPALRFGVNRAADARRRAAREPRGRLRGDGETAGHRPRAWQWGELHHNYLAHPLAAAVDDSDAQSDSTSARCRSAAAPTRRTSRLTAPATSGNRTARRSAWWSTSATGTTRAP